MRFATAALLPLLAVSATTAAAQVGTVPERSPFRDVEFGQILTVSGGWYAAGEDIAGVAPTSGPMAALRYDIRLGGPVWFTGSVASAFTERTVLDPRRGPATRVVGEESTPLVFADIGLTAHLTGQKSWRRLVPTLGVGLGIATDFRSGRDVGDFAIGTPFAFSVSGGVLYVPDSDRFAFRAQITDYLYKLSYPELYQRQPAPGVEPILGPGEPSSDWTSNLALTVGVVYRLFR